MKALDWKKSEAPFLYNQEKEIYQKEYGSYFRVKQINIMHWRRQGKSISSLEILLCSLLAAGRAIGFCLSLT